MSVTRALSRFAKAVSTVAVWPLPETLATTAGAEAVFVSVAVTESEPTTDAVTAKLPAVPLAVIIGLVATPSLPVVAETTPPAKLPPAPLVGNEKLTVTPATGFPLRSTARTLIGFVNAADTWADCPPPDTTSSGRSAFWLVTSKLVPA
jgi:hypothetical protein